MKAHFMNKKGAVLPMRTTGRKQKSGLLTWAFIIVGGVFLVMGATGVYNKWLAPALDSKGITSSLEDSSGDIVIEGSSSQYLDRPDAASFTFQVLDTANDNAVISAGIPVGGITQVTDADGVTTVKEYLSTASDETNDTITSVPEDTVLTFYGGDATYYLNPLTGRQIDIGDKITLYGATIQTEANMVVTVYDDTGSTALSTADVSGAHDYKATLGEGQREIIYIKLSNNGADGTFNIKSICTGTEGANVSSLEIVGSDWTKGLRPIFVEDGAVDVNETETNSALTSAEYETCYVYKTGTNEVISLEEWEDTPNIKAMINAKTGKNPTDDVVFFTAFDGAWARGSDGKAYFDFYQHDGDEASVGLLESIDSPLGKQLGAIIELD